MSDDDRLPMDYYEADGEGGWIATYEGADGELCVELGQYIRYPWLQDAAMGELERLQALDTPGCGFYEWLSERYPGIDFNFDADEDITASVGDAYREGESTEDLIMRLHDQPVWIRLMNEGAIYYQLRDAWAKHLGVELYPEVVR